jgi:hypothetical protein
LSDEKESEDLNMSAVESPPLIEDTDEVMVDATSVASPSLPPASPSKGLSKSENSSVDLFISEDIEPNESNSGLSAVNIVIATSSMNLDSQDSPPFPSGLNLRFRSVFVVF